MEIDLLKDFVGISHWQSFLAIAILVVIIIGFAKFIKKTKINFTYRIFIGMFIGLIFGLSIQAATGFNKNNITNINSGGESNNNYLEWAGQVARWTELIKNIFITGIGMLTIPIVFLAIARIVAKKNNQNTKLVKMSVAGIIILLLNVAVAFTIAFALGYFFKIGNNIPIDIRDGNNKEAAKGLWEIISGYIPKSFFGVFTQNLIIPVIILAALVGYAIKKLTKRNEESMNKARNALEIMWKITISILTVFIKIMPYAILSMLASALINNPIGKLGDIGIIIGVAYLALILTFIWHLITLFCFGVKPLKWVKKSQRALITAFTTQSSNATLPIALETLKDEIKVKEEATDTIMPLSTTMGLSGCAGVQAGIILSFLWFSVISKGEYPQWTIAILFINGLVVTLIASLGIAGVPGTASIVTAGVLGGLGFGSLYAPVYGVIGALDGLFDMGRTFVNISGGLQATSIVGKTNNLLINPQLQNHSFLFKKILLITRNISILNELQKQKNLKIQTLKRSNKTAIKNLDRSDNNKFLEHKKTLQQQLTLDIIEVDNNIKRVRQKISIAKNNNKIKLLKLVAENKAEKKQLVVAKNWRTNKKKLNISFNEQYFELVIQEQNQINALLAIK